MSIEIEELNNSSLEEIFVKKSSLEEKYTRFFLDCNEENFEKRGIDYFIGSDRTEPYRKVWVLHYNGSCSHEVWNDKLESFLENYFSKRVTLINIFKGLSVNHYPTYEFVLKDD